jgi:hypothetical protein
VLNELAEFPGVSISNASGNSQDATITVLEPQFLESRRKRDFAARLSMFPKEKRPKVRMVGNESGEFREGSLKDDEKTRDDYAADVKRMSSKIEELVKRGKVPSEKEMQNFYLAAANWQVWTVVCVERKLDRACQKGGENYKKIRDIASDTIDSAIAILEQATGQYKNSPPEAKVGLYRHGARLLRQVATIQERYKFSPSEWKKISKPLNDPNDGGPMGGEGGIVGAACNNVANLYYWKNLNPPTKEGEAMYGGDGANFAVARFWLEKGAKAGDRNAMKSLGGIKMRAQMAGLGITVVDRGMDEGTGLPIGYLSGEKPDESSLEYCESAINTTKVMDEMLGKTMKRKVKRQMARPAKDRDPNAGAKGEYVSKKCIVDGLVSKPHLNGEECVPSKWSDEKQRYGVYDFNSAGLWIKPVNIIPKSEYYTYITDEDDDDDDDDDYSDYSDDENDEDRAEKLKKANLTSGGKNARDMQSLKYFKE